jgi:hypothetical protein
MPVLSSELRAWLQPGLVGVIATVDVTGQPDIVRNWGARLQGEPDVVEIYVLRSSAQRCLQNLAGSGRAALNLIELPSYRSRTFKGTCRVREAEIDAAFLAENLLALDRAFSSVGMPPGSVQRMLFDCDDARHMLALQLSVDSVFDQSPKPGAGAPL